MENQEIVLTPTAECFNALTKEAGNLTGRCCCNCKWQRSISGHPWNKTPAFYGRVTGIIAWGCTAPDMDSITLFEREHSLCEMHERKA